MLVSTILFVALSAILAKAFVLPDVEQLTLTEGLSEKLVGEDIQTEETCSKKVAIIGSGITGAVAAFRLYENYRRQASPDQRPCITVFERNSIVGGCITQAYIYDDPRMPIDTCAETFAAGDQCIASSILDVGLTPEIEAVSRPLAGVGVWNGMELVGPVDEDGFRGPEFWSFYKSMQWSQQYKDAPLNFSQNATLVRQVFDLTLGPDVQVGQGETNFSRAIEQLRPYLQGPLCFNQTLSQEEKDFASQAIVPGLRERFFKEGLEYNLLEFYLGLEEALSSSVMGGNLRLVERLLLLSGAKIRLDTQIEEIRDQAELGSDQSVLKSVDLADGSTSLEKFDTVVLATSLSRSNITFVPQLSDAPGFRQQYTDSFVTHFTTPKLLNKAFFNWTGTMPQNIFTQQRSASEDDTRVPFFSLNLVREVVDRQRPDVVENLFKLVTREEVSDTDIMQYLEPLMASDPAPIINWIHREPLPRSVPITPYDVEKPCRSFLEKIEIVPNVFYAGAGEQVVASAEFGCRMGANAAALIAPVVP